MARHEADTSLVRILSRISIRVEPPTAAQLVLADLQSTLRDFTTGQLIDAQVKSGKTAGRLILQLLVEVHEDDDVEKITFDIAQDILLELPRGDQDLATGSNFLIPA